MMPGKRPVLDSHCAGQDNFSITATLEVSVYLTSIFSPLPHYFQSKMSGELKKSFKILSCIVFSISLRSSGFIPSLIKFVVYIALI